MQSFSGEDGGLLAGSAFDDQIIRRGFVKKVYGILTAQLFATMAVMGFFQIPELSTYSYNNPWIFWVAFCLSFSCLIALSCFPNVRRNSPGNMICLFIFTFAEGLLLGAVGASYKVEEIFLAVGITTILVVGLTLFAWQTKIDFTAMGGVLLVGFLILFIISIVAIFVRNKILSIVYASIGAFLFSCYIIFDTQLMMGGKHKYSLDPEEYIFAALNLYLDVINLFMFILNIIGSSRN